MDVQQLSRLAGHLEDCASEMKSAGYKMEQASVREIGHADLEERCGEFRDAWKYGIQQLSKLTDAIQGGVRKTAENYAETDRRIGEFFAGGGGETGGGSAASGSTSTEAGGQNYSLAADFG
ncbi:hypothetical protein QQM39_10905 [Streptomyces sp. DT2A-34]|uniref:hypothetical protein n=1 Tax=Streptomyces sp. DT2A-34 TaxID=3051182 RepID=UPI00265BF833|nr:hypothetical protein [Streptomyces sp. DT2A-34]MDO0911342.1 hypothetical protein [Streptomyces sp. DT2A-34]